MSEVGETLQRLEAQAASEHAETVEVLASHHSELLRVVESFGFRAAMEFAWEHFEVTGLAFLVEFELFEMGEKLGVFAL